MASSGRGSRTSGEASPRTREHHCRSRINRNKDSEQERSSQVTIPFQIYAHTLKLLRQRYWLIRARATVRTVLYQCVTCAWKNARVPEQFMGDLPDFRVNLTSRAFNHTGVNYASPLLVRTTKG